MRKISINVRPDETVTLKFPKGGILIITRNEANNIYIVQGQHNGIVNSFRFSKEAD